MGMGMGPGGASGGFALGGFSVVVGADMVPVEGLKVERIRGDLTAIETS
jgi:hypothetical protein